MTLLDANKFCFSPCILYLVLYLSRLLDFGPMIQKYCFSSFDDDGSACVFCVCVSNYSSGFSEQILDAYLYLYMPFLVPHGSLQLGQ